MRRAFAWVMAVGAAAIGCAEANPASDAAPAAAISDAEDSGGDAGDAVAAPSDSAADSGGDEGGPDGDAKPFGWLPASTADLYGAWENNDGETTRRYEFRFLDNAFADLFNITPAYRLYRAKAGSPAEIVERGEYKLSALPALVTTPQWAQDIATVGKKRVNVLVPAKQPFTFELEVVPGVTREFVRVESWARFP